MAFHGDIISAFELAERGAAFLLRLEDGVPEVGDVLQTDLGQTVVLALDDYGVRTESCLTGVPILPQIGVAVGVPFTEAKGWQQTKVTGGSPEEMKLAPGPEEMTHKAGES